MMFLLLLVLSGLLVSSAALRNSVEDLVGEVWDFGNRWLRRFIMAVTTWPTLMICAAATGTIAVVVPNNIVFVTTLIAIAAASAILAFVAIVRVGGRQGWIVGALALLVSLVMVGVVSFRGSSFSSFNGPAVALAMGFAPSFVALFAIAAEPMALFIPAGVNALEHVIESGVAGVPLLKRIKPSVQLPRVPSITKILWPVALFCIASLLMGVYLYVVPVRNDPVLLVVLVALSISIGLLNIFNKGKGTRRLLQVAFVVVTAIICLGGRSQAQASLKNLPFPTFQSPPPATAINYGRRMCENSFGQVIPLEDFPAGDIAKFNEGCFGPYLRLPKNWPGWGGQPSGDHPDPDWWVAFWFEGEQNPVGPYSLRDLQTNPPNFQYRSGTFRLQGKAGEGILLYKIR
ncbi:MAG: hypothetical protein KGJ13_00695 [Patescibacteria group bacterium]|nr:hypothetical protein [Patescibacteria group bacterium]